ncbi:hypothetical protein KBD13_01560 [Patescibacteria group bacterium]|nr:hypothetical protein [Patescibacteria group bacterium]
MSESPRSFYPKTEETPVYQFPSIDETSTEPTRAHQLRQRARGIKESLGAAALALMSHASPVTNTDEGAKIHTQIAHDSFSDVILDTSEEEKRLQRTDDAGARARSDHHRRTLWQSYTKRLDAGGPVSHTVQGIGYRRTVYHDRVIEAMETDIMQDIGPEFRQEVMRHAGKQARLLLQQRELPKTVPAALQAIDTAIDTAVQEARRVAHEQGWHGVHLLRADSLAMRVISKELLEHSQEYSTPSANQVYERLFTELRQRATDKRRVEQASPDLRRETRESTTGFALTNALPETESLPDIIALDQFAWHGDQAGDAGRFEYLRGHPRDVRILLEAGYLSWIEHAAMTMRRDPSLSRSVAGELQRLYAFGDILPQDERRVSRIIQVLRQ